MTDLIAFLNARLDEDEALIRRNSDGRGLADGFPDYRTWRDGDTEAADEYIEHFGPARALREVEADRALLGKLRQVEALGDRLRVDTEIMILRQVIAIRAAIWNDHPDYEGWLQ